MFQKYKIPTDVSVLSLLPSRRYIVLVLSLKVVVSFGEPML